MRRKYVAGNWKMNLNMAEATALVDGLLKGLPKDANLDVAVFPSFVYLAPLADKLKGTPIGIGAQNCYFEAKGAFTGEIAPQMIKDIGCQSVIIGHSERRHVLGETNDVLKKKVLAALDAGLKVIYCVGETLDEREGNKTEAVLDSQIKDVLGGEIPLDNIVIAYEPVWAIGTGKTATPEQAQEVHAAIRALVGEVVTAGVAAGIRILYGGSVKPDNVDALMAKADIDGALVGGASLKADSFTRLVRFEK